MQDQALIHWEDRQVGGYATGPDARVTIPRLIEMLHEASIAQVVRMKLSALELARHQLTWVLVQQYLEVDHRPKFGDQVRIQTYPSGKNRLYTFRDFRMHDPDNRLLAAASSTWLLMNTSDRSIGKYPTYIADLLDASNQLDHLPRAPSLKIRLDAEDAHHEFLVRQHDLDFNGHLASPHFVRLMLDAVPSATFAAYELNSFNIRLKEEARLGDTVQVRLRKETSRNYLHELVRNEKVIAYARSSWREA